MLAEPSTASPRGTPSSSILGTSATPEDNFMLDIGQCATPVPVSASRFSSSSVKWIPWANHTSSPIHPRLSIYSRGRIPKRSVVNRSSSFVSARWVWSLTPSSLASCADSFKSVPVTLKGEQGANATWCMEYLLLS